jgi:hypothetical protein
MQTLPKPRLRRLNIRLSQQEWDQVKTLSSDTTCRNVSEYARLLLLDKPVRVFYDNPSLDNFEQLMTRLLAELDDLRDKIDNLLNRPDSPGSPGSPFGSGSEPALFLLLSAHENYAKKTKEIKEAILKIAGKYDQRLLPPKE